MNEAIEALLRLENTLEMAGAMSPMAARDVAAVRLALGQRGGSAAPLKAALLRVACAAVLPNTYARGVLDATLTRGALDDLVLDQRLDGILDAEDQRRIIAAVNKRIAAA